ncbi:VOC family protein [Paeniglutamicibacter sp. MACA_103]|uniref:VOC family protein n=1 Tax=Paeniglutamicibacter sp. MACA_103 TaxID=3377337 RepID=UPI0038953F8E
MDHSLQITIDSINPHRQAVWWAETLGWTVEPSDPDFIQKMIDEGHASEDETLIFDGELAWRSGAGICPLDQLGKQPRQRILFQLVHLPKTMKNRIHLDLNLGDRDEVRDSLVERGATFLHAAAQGPFAWYTLADPEGNEFCIR